MGAWIETFLGHVYFIFCQSHPTWVRGLKPKSLREPLRLEVSHPTWVRGLKRFLGQMCTKYTPSHPTWVRGLKLLLRVRQKKTLRRTLRGCVD